MYVYVATLFYTQNKVAYANLEFTEQPHDHVPKFDADRETVQYKEVTETHKYVNIA